MESELTHHLGYDKYSSAGKKSGNSRNGKSSKTIKGDFGELPIEVPRDRNGDFNPHIIPKRNVSMKMRHFSPKFRVFPLQFLVLVY